MRQRPYGHDGKWLVIRGSLKHPLHWKAGTSVWGNTCTIIGLAACMKVASQCRRAQALLLRSFATSGIAGTSIGCAPPGFSALDPRALCSGNAVATSAVAFIGSEARRHEHSRLDLGHEGLPAVVPASASSTVEGGRAEKLVLRQLVAGRVHETILQSASLPPHPSSSELLDTP